jgi:hypothetical protein
MTENPDSQASAEEGSLEERTFDKASDVNADAPGSKTGPPGSGDRDEADIAKGMDKLEQAGGGH